MSTEQPWGTISRVSNLPRVIEPGDDYEVEVDYIDQQQYEAVLGVFARKRLTHWHLLTRILRATGLREAECLRLKPEHIKRNGPDSSILVVRGKQRLATGKEPKYEAVLLQSEVAHELDMFMATHRVSRGWPIFETKARAFQLAFRNASLEVLGEAHHPHELRALYATELIDGGVPLAVVSKMLGHTSEKTTLAYYLRVSRAKRDAINARVRA